MKPNRYERHYTDTTPPKDGMSYQRAQLTGIQRNKAKLGFNCDHCGFPFEKYACWAKRTKYHYCGRACASAAKVVRIPKPCVVCGTEMLLTPSKFNRTSGCSRACMRKRRTVNYKNLRSSPDYVAIVKRLKKEALCGVCGTTNGPWVVQGVKIWVEDGLSCADGGNAHLVCQHCHLRGVNYLSMQSTYMSNRVKYYKEKNNG
jgi:hypothetical protein